MGKQSHSWSSTIKKHNDCTCKLSTQVRSRAHPIKCHCTHVNNRYLANKTSPWKTEFAEMYRKSSSRYEQWKGDATKKQTELVQAAQEWIEQDFNGHHVELPSSELLQSS